MWEGNIMGSLNEYYKIRNVETMRQFPFMMDCQTQLNVTKKLETIGFTKDKYPKGTIAALIRTLLNEWANDMLDTKGTRSNDLDEYWAEAIKEEYCFTRDKGKRSNM